MNILLGCPRALNALRVHIRNGSNRPTAETKVPVAATSSASYLRDYGLDSRVEARLY
jgi:hypothetical protein